MSSRKSPTINHYYKVTFTLSANDVEIVRYITGYPISQEVYLRDKIKKIVSDTNMQGHLRSHFKIDKWHGSPTPTLMSGESIMDLSGLTTQSQLRSKLAA